MINIMMVATEPEAATQARLTLPDGYRVRTVPVDDKMPATLDNSTADVILLDLPVTLATALLERLVREPDSPPVIVCGALVDDEAIVGAIHAGAVDYLAKPYTTSRLRRAVDLAVTTYAVRKAGLPDATGEGFLGGSRYAHQVLRSVRAFAADDAPVLILGESGTGKELVAGLIHRSSARAAGPFEPINCSAVPDTLFETEMFGCERGAYTDAVSRPGLLERASGGTVFLDEIGETSMHSQVKLLRVLESGVVTRVGGRKPVPIDCRVIAATNRDLRGRTNDGTFRDDLYYRIAVLILLIAPLRRRRQDIPLLAWDYLNRIDPQGKQFTPAAMQRLTEYPWPGNVRELRNVIHRSHLFANGERIKKSDLRFS